MSDIQSIKQRYDLPGVCHAHGIALRQSGSSFLGLCPFHDDHHPSFSVYLTQSGWYFKCHAGSCGLSGDVIDFSGYQAFGPAWNKRDSSMFKTVLASLEQGAKALPANQWVREFPPPRGTRLVSDTMRFLWDVALGIYADHLSRSGPAADYLAGRRIPAELVRTNRFGLCPFEGSSLRYVARIFNKQDEDLVEAGLFRPSQREGEPVYEFLYGRITFADVDHHRNPLYLYGRALPGGGLSDESARYLGLPGFSKPVFGLHDLSDRNESVFLMEGPINAMLCRYWGFDAIAFSGALPSPEQVELIRRKIIASGRRLIPVLDNDRAGAAASERWKEVIPEIEAPILLPARVKGQPIKDINDLHCSSPNAYSIFKRLIP